MCRYLLRVKSIRWPMPTWLWCLGPTCCGGRMLPWHSVQSGQSTTSPASCLTYIRRSSLSEEQENFSFDSTPVIVPSLFHSFCPSATSCLPPYCQMHECFNWVKLHEKDTRRRRAVELSQKFRLWFKFWQSSCLSCRSHVAASADIMVLHRHKSFIRSVSRGLNQ